MGDADLVEAARFAEESEARRAVEDLIVRGVGAMIEPDTGEASGSGAASYVVMTVRTDRARARELLGLPEERLEGEPDPVQAELARKRREMFKVLAVFAAALVVIPLVAFYLSYTLAGR